MNTYSEYRSDADFIQAVESELDAIKLYYFLDENTVTYIQSLDSLAAVIDEFNHSRYRGRVFEDGTGNEKLKRITNWISLE